MRVLIVGLGSVGRRHLRNLMALGVRELSAYRVRGEPLGDLDGAVQVHADLETALDRARPQAVVIANPTALHLPIALAAARRGCHLYIEKPLSHTMDGVDELEAIVSQKRLAVMIGCNLRFDSGYRRLKSLLAEDVVGCPLSARIEVGQYLPDWHPGENHRLGYSARAELGGGVILTLIHELDYAHDLFGDVARVSALTTHAKGLGTDVEDLAEILLQFRSGMIASVHLDHVQQPPSRNCKIVCEGGTLVWNVLEGRVTVRRGATQEVYEEGVDRNGTFLAALRHFLDCAMLDKTPSPSLDEGRRVLEIALSAKQAAASNGVVVVECE